MEAPMTISPELRQALERSNGQPLRLEDPENDAAYVVVRADAYARMQAVLEEDEIDPSFFEIEDFEPAREDPR
jgi:hypothetical protein